MTTSYAEAVAPLTHSKQRAVDAEVCHAADGHATRADADAAAARAPLRIVCISDTHERHWRLQGVPSAGREPHRKSIPMPAGDVLIHAGDIFMRSCKQTWDDFLPRLRDFNAWLGTVRPLYRHGVIVTAGNHDAWLERMGRAHVQRELTNARYLVDEAVTVDGVSFFVSPMSLGYSSNKAFQARVPEPLAALFPRAYYDVVVTHHSHELDELLEALTVAVVPPTGDLRSATSVPRCRLHVGGHDHHQYGVTYRSLRHGAAVEAEAAMRNQAARPHRSPELSEPERAGVDARATAQLPVWAPKFITSHSPALERIAQRAEYDRLVRHGRGAPNKLCPWIACAVGSSVDEGYRLVNAPVVVDMPRQLPPWRASTELLRL
jgi:predicted phosphodiesterase